MGSNLIGVIGSVFGIVGVAAAIIFGYLNYHRNTAQDTYKSGATGGTLQADIEYIKRRTDDVLLEQKDTNKSVNALAERVTRVEESAKQAHKRIDRLDKAGEDKEE